MKNLESELVEKLFQEEIDISQMSWIFEWIPDICFFAKNLKGRFVMCNQSALTQFGCNTKSDFIGKNDHDIASYEIAVGYIEQDQKVIKSKKPILNFIEPVPNPEGLLSWFSTSKIPLFNSDKKVIGVAVILRDITEMGALLGPYQKLTSVIEYIFKNYTSQIKVTDLAQLASISVKQLERQFSKLFGITPIRFIHEHRIRIASQLLLKSDMEIKQVAIKVGFYDHAHFVRIFKSIKSTSPLKYRKSYS